MLHLFKSIFLPASNVSKHKYIVFKRNKVNSNQHNRPISASRATHYSKECNEQGPDLETPLSWVTTPLFEESHT